MHQSKRFHFLSGRITLVDFLKLIFGLRERVSLGGLNMIHCSKESEHVPSARVINTREFFRSDRSIGRYTLDERYSALGDLR